ncbi:MAG: polyprenyl synthetase family protein [Polyangia bacterium]
MLASDLLIFLSRMEAEARIETTLERAVATATVNTCPARLAEAVRYAVFPGGGRIRPGLCLAVADACGAPGSRLAEAAAAAVELLHCASLIQDDLPCFDDASLRRGRPALHQRFSQEIAILVGDVLIVSAFDLVAAEVADLPIPAANILRALARGAGAPVGLAAGQAWESEPAIDVAAYHRAKTAALFEAAAVAGAEAAEVNPEAWRKVGGLLGEAYQLADDLADALGESAQLGKPIEQDRHNQRPNMVTRLGAGEASQRLDDLLARAKQYLPACSQRRKIEEFLDRAAGRLRPSGWRAKVENLARVAGVL